jgi:ABC-2 type transport system ATP-binding protein
VSAATAPTLECRDLHKRFGERQAVAGLGFEVAPGECYGLLGPNGAGKTTTISMIAGLLEPDAGEVVVAGRPMGPRATAARAALGLVPQEIALYPDLSATENLRFFGRLQGLAGRRLAERVAAVLATVGLADRAADRVASYSGGMKRRVNIAAGLLHEPRLLILDEPTVGVDPQSRNAILEQVETLRDAGMAVLYTTHYMEEAERLCDRVGVVDEGRIVAEGTRRELVATLGQTDRLRVTATGDLDDLARRCRSLPGVDRVDVAAGAVEILVDDGRRALTAVARAAEDAGVAVDGIELVEPDLEGVFLALTGKALRD